MRITISNAGIVITGAFLPQFFARLNLTKNGSFVNYEAQNRAVFLLQHLAFNEIDFPEYHFPLNKLLVGLSIEEPITQISEITAAEKAMCVSLLDGIIANWEKVSNSTYAAIQESFFQREGLLTIENSNILKVEQMGIDVLVRTIPWNFSLIKFPWMNQPLQVEW